MKKLNRSSIDLPDKVKRSVCELLSTQLANLVDLQLQLKQAHWNVRGSHFHSYHELFEKLARVLDDHVDTVAERITALGGLAAGGARHVAVASQLKDLPLTTTKDKELIAALQQRYKVAASSARKAIDAADDLDDDDTEDLLVQVSRDLDKGLWFLDATVG